MFFFAGLLYVAFILLLPYLFTLVSKSSDSIFVPVNSQNNQCGDNRIYASCVNEARLNFFRHRHPSSDQKGAMAVDLLRFNTYRLLTLLGLGIRDFRVAFLVSFTLSLLLQYTVLYLVMLKLGSAKIPAVLLSLVILFFSKFIHVFKEKNVVNAITGYVVGKVLNWQSKSVQGRISDNLRYCITSASNIFLWTSVLLSLSLGDMTTMYEYLSVAFFMLIGLLVYPPTTLISFVILGIAMINEALMKGVYDCWMILIFFFSALVLIFSIKSYRLSFLDILKGDHQVLGESHDSKDKLKFSIKVKRMLFNSVSLVSGLILLANFYFVEIELIYTITSFVFIFNLLGYLINKEVIFFRFYERGFSDALFFAMVATLYFFLRINLGTSSLDIFLTVISIVILMSFLVGQFKMSKAQFLGRAYLTNPNEWSIYEFIRKHIPNRSSILTFDYSTLQLIPVYTHANLFVSGAEWLKEPSEEIARYSHYYNKYKGNTTDFLHKFENYFAQKKRFSCSPNEKNFEDNLSDYLLVNTLLYIPHVKTFKGVVITDKTTDNWTPEFLESLNKLNKSAKVKDKPNYFLFKKDEFERERILVDLQIIFENDAFILASTRL